MNTWFCWLIPLVDCCRRTLFSGILRTLSNIKPIFTSIWWIWILNNFSLITHHHASSVENTIDAALVPLVKMVDEEVSLRYYTAKLEVARTSATNYSTCCCFQCSGFKGSVRLSLKSSYSLCFVIFLVLASIVLCDCMIFWR